MSKPAYVIPVDGRVLACLDASVYTDSVVDHAAWAASRLGAPLQFLHVLDRQPQVAQLADYSGNIGVHAQTELLSELVTLDEKRSKLAAERGRQLLAHARARAAEAGIGESDAIQRHGSFVETITEDEDGVRLYVIGKRGEHADFDKGHLGANLERAVRSVHRPLLVASRAFRPVQRFAIAFDGSPTTRKCVEMVVQSPLLKGLPCDLLSAGNATFELREAQSWARRQLEQAGFQVDARIVAGDPESVIGEHIVNAGVDLLVMGAYGHSRIRQLIVGSTTTAMIRGCLVPVLLLR
ncbi:MAG: universal stress protein [Lysobacteraceae bacterium]